MNPLSIIAGPLINGINSLGKTFFGSKEERDRQSQEQFMSVQNSYQAEQSAPEKQNWFNILVDGFNRLQRPAMTSGVIALFVWAAVDPASFIITMQALTTVPEMLWYILTEIDQVFNNIKMMLTENGKFIISNGFLETTLGSGVALPDVEVG